MTTQNFDDLIAALTKFDVFEADRVFYVPSVVNGDMRPTGTAWNFQWIIWYAGSVFRHENLKTLSPYLRDFEAFVRILGELTGVDLQVDNGERASLRFIRAMKCLRQYGTAANDARLVKLKSIADKADAIWTLEMKHRTLVAELAKRFGESERTIERRFKAMRDSQLPEFKSYPWLNLAKSVNTRKPKTK